jgi:SAM-dependent methyltransferase
MHRQTTDVEYLRYQYGDTERLRIRTETHRLYSKRTDDFRDWVLDFVSPAGQLVLDVGCGFGAYHPPLHARGVRSIIGLDASPAMIEATRKQAWDQSLPVHVILGDAQSLPLPDASADRVMANHVLYHVPDQLSALREIRRVLRPGGRAMIVANAADHVGRLLELHEEAARQLGYTPSGSVGDRFNLGHLSLVRQIFPTAELHVRPDAFIFPTADAALRYYASGYVDLIEERTDGEHRAKLVAVVAARIEDIIAREGSFLVPKDAGCFVAEI